MTTRRAWCIALNPMFQSLVASKNIDKTGSSVPSQNGYSRLMWNQCHEILYPTIKSFCELLQKMFLHISMTLLCEMLGTLTIVFVTLLIAS